jgi:hypothetical protein
VTPLDPLTFGAVPVVILLTALVAAARLARDTNQPGRGVSQ